MGDRISLNLPAFTFVYGPENGPTLLLKVYYLGKFRPSVGKDKKPIADREEHTLRIESLKYRKEPDAIQYFLSKLDPILPHGNPITIVPSADPDNRSSGLTDLVGELAKNDRIDATSCLVRHKKIPPSALAGNYKERTNEARHYDSIRVEHEDVIKGKAVLLIDDITTTGTTLKACRKLLLNSGASEVVCIVLGRTERKPDH